MSLEWCILLSLRLSRNTRRPCYVCKGLTYVGATGESSELLHLLRLNGHVGAILT